MKAPRFRIAGIMVAVAIAAGSFAAIPGLFDIGPGGVLLAFGALPMANVLIVGILIARQSLTGRPFLLGFEVFGGIALTLYVCLVAYSARNPYGPQVAFVLLALDLKAAIGPNPPPSGTAIGLFVGVIMLVGPQIVFALIGGFLSRSFNVTITPRG
jgi:hypothetical protein